MLRAPCKSISLRVCLKLKKNRMSNWILKFRGFVLATWKSHASPSAPPVFLETENEQNLNCILKLTGLGLWGSNFAMFWNILSASPSSCVFLTHKLRNMPNWVSKPWGFELEGWLLSMFVCWVPYLYRSLIYQHCNPYSMPKRFSNRKRRHKGSTPWQTIGFVGHMAQVQTYNCPSAKDKSSWRRLLSYVCAHSRLTFFKHLSVAVTDRLPFLKHSSVAKPNPPQEKSFSQATIKWHFVPVVHMVKWIDDR